jgi:hypothetical protein
MLDPPAPNQYPMRFGALKLNPNQAKRSKKWATY